MAVTVQSYDTATLNSVGTSITVNKPSGVVDGDFLVAGISSKSGAADFTTPSGWTAVGDHISATGYNASRMFYRVASSEPATYEFTATSSEKMSAFVLRIDGQDTSDPLNASGSDDSDSTQAASVSPSVTTTEDGCMILSFHANRAQTAPADGSPPAGMSQTVIAEISFGAAAAVAQVVQSSAGASGTKSWTLDASAKWTAWTMAIAPAAGGGGGGGGTAEGGRPPIKRGLYVKSGEDDETGIPSASFWNKADSSSRIRGACPIIFWFNIETSKDVYDFSVIDSAIVQADAIGKELMFELRVHSFGASSEDPSTVGVPAYIYQSSEYGGVAGAYGLARKHKNQFSARLWDANVMERIALLYEAVLAYCSGKLPSVVFNNESTPGAIDRDNPDAADYTVAKMNAQYKILIERATAAAGSDTRFCFVGNFIKLGDNGDDGDLDINYDECVANDAGWSSADPLALAKPVSGVWSNYRMQTQDLGGSGSTANPAVDGVPPIPYMPLGEQGAGAFTDLTGYLTGSKSLLDFMLYHIEHCKAECIVVTVNYKATAEYKNGRLGYEEIVDILDDSAVPAADLAVMQTWAEAADSQGGVTGAAAQILPSLTQSAVGVRGNAAAQTLPNLTQAATGSVGTNVGTIAQPLPGLAQAATGTASGVGDSAAQTLPSLTQSGAGRTFYWAQIVPGTETWRVQ